jgi:hypothetical protein
MIALYNYSILMSYILFFPPILWFCRSQRSVSVPAQVRPHPGPFGQAVCLLPRQGSQGADLSQPLTPQGRQQVTQREVHWTALYHMGHQGTYYIYMYMYMYMQIVLCV